MKYQIFFDQTTIDACHEKLDDAFETSIAHLYTSEIQQEQPEIKGTLPPPGGTPLANITGRVATIARSTGVVTGAAVGSASLKHQVSHHLFQNHYPISLHLLTLKNY